MPSMPPELILIRAPFAQLFFERGWIPAQILVVGVLLAPGKRTGSSGWQMRGLGLERHFTPYHRVLNRAQWATLQAGKILLGVIVTWLVPPGAVMGLGADDTLERRSGRKITAKGCYRDAVRSAKQHGVPCFGLKGVAMRVLVPVPWAKRVWALPFLNVRCWSQAKAPRGRHKTSGEWVRQMMKQVRRWLPERLLVLGVDGGFAAVALALACQEQQGTLVARLRLEAAFYHPPAPQPPGKRGRKPTKGKCQRNLKVWAARSDPSGEPVEVGW